MKKLVIFDLDGTLLNTIDDLGAAVNYALTKYGFPTHELSRYKFMVGNGVQKLIERAVPTDNSDEQTIEKLLTEFKAYYDDHNCDMTKPYEGISELLENLQNKGIKIAVASNKYQQATDVIVRHFFPNINFAVISGQKEGVPVKPDPSIIFNILLQTKCAKEDTLYVGDSGVDMETAYRACVDAVGVTWGFRTEVELRHNKATYIADTASQILELAESDNHIYSTL